MIRTLDDEHNNICTYRDSQIVVKFLSLSDLSRVRTVLCSYDKPGVVGTPLWRKDAISCGIRQTKWWMTDSERRTVGRLHQQITRGCSSSSAVVCAPAPAQEQRVANRWTGSTASRISKWWLEALGNVKKVKESFFRKDSCLLSGLHCFIREDGTDIASYKSPSPQGVIASNVCCVGEHAVHKCRQYLTLPAEPCWRGLRVNVLVRTNEF